jgi:uncharacterized membrane protein (UPF0127 family)
MSDIGGTKPLRHSFLSLFKTRFTLTFWLSVAILTLICTLLWLFCKPHILLFKLQALTWIENLQYPGQANEENDIKRLSIVSGSPSEYAKIIITVEIPKNLGPEAGLAKRDSLDKDKGMLYKLSKPLRFPFWMNNMKFPLDIILIKEALVVGYMEDLQPPFYNQPKESIKRYIPEVEFDQALEVNAGFIKVYNIQIGDKIYLSNPK